MIAGMAITPLSKMNGLEAMAIACAAFCIPTSMTMVRLVLVLNLNILDRRAAPLIANKISKVMHAPKIWMFS